MDQFAEILIPLLEFRAVSGSRAEMMIRSFDQLAPAG
jgi:hypothetical protein